MTESNQQNSLLGKIAAYTEILAKDPKSTIFVSLSEAYRKMGMLDDSRSVVEQGIESHQDFSPAHIVLGRILCQQGDYEGSEVSFQRALQYDVDNLAALVGYARLSILLGREGKARELLLSARKLSPADPIINKLLLSLPETEAQVEVETEAQIEVETEEISINSDPVSDMTIPANEVVENSPLISGTLAELYLKQGLVPQALEVYRQLSTKDPNNFLLRRKIRDLEEGQIESLPIDNNKPSSVEFVEDQEESVAVVVTDETPQVKPEDDPVDSLVVGGVTVSASPVVVVDNSLEILQKWLDSIQQRREDV